MDMPSPAARQIRAMHSLSAAGKNAHGCRCTAPSVPSVLDLLLKEQHRVRLERQSAAWCRAHSVWYARAATHPTRIFGVQPFSPRPMWDGLNQAHFAIVEVENCQHFIGSIPAAHSQDAIFFEAHDVHFVFAQTT